MAAIHTLPPGRCGDTGTHTSEETNPDSARTRYVSARTLTWARTSGWKKLLPKPDIPNCIALSKLRCIITFVSLALLMTDIPRTGLGVRNLQEYYPVPLMPSTAVRFGPFNYPVLHVWRLDHGSSSFNSDITPSTQFAGLKGTQPISSARVWSYQYDTTSVGLRGAVELLNVTKFPSFLLYKPQQGQPPTNANSLIAFNTTFTMLDSILDAAQTQLRSNNDKTTTLRYATKHNWVDRIHHYIVRFASKNPAWRLHSLHVPHISRNKSTFAICSNTGAHKHSSPRPRFCNHPGIWKCKNPLNASSPDVRLWDHMDLRLQSLQQQYPDLELDVALLSTQRLSSTTGAMRSTFYNYEALEIVVLTRGRRCVENMTNSSSMSNSIMCTTVFVDDYRYERDIVQTNLVDWYGIISILRGGAQTYVWIRLVLLIYGAYTVAGQSFDEGSNMGSRLATAASIVFKIPFQVIVYSSLVPVCAYVGALMLDSSFTDIFLDSYWATVGGAVNLQWVPFIQTTSVQMRCVWLLALFASVVLYAVRGPRYNGDGILGIRGLLISFTSSLTVFGPYKSVFYRDMDIVSIFILPDAGQTMDVVQSSNPSDCFNSSSYTSGGSLQTMRLCIVAVAGCAIALKLLGHLTPRLTWTHVATRDVMFKLSQAAPCGIESLWKSTSPVIHFSASIRAQISQRNSVSSKSAHTMISQCPSTSFSVSRVTPSPPPDVSGISENIAATNLPPHQRRLLWRRRRTSATIMTGGLISRTTESHSILQLMNVAMMTDPWSFFWLRTVGVQLYLYKVRPALPAPRGLDWSLLTYVVILPYEEEELEKRAGLSCDDYELLDLASSRDVPWPVLLQCG